MLKPQKTAEEYCVLRVPFSTRAKIVKIAEEQPFPANWTVVAKQMLIDGIERQKENDAKAQT